MVTEHNSSNSDILMISMMPKAAPFTYVCQRSKTIIFAAVLLLCGACLLHAAENDRKPATAAGKTEKQAPAAKSANMETAESAKQGEATAESGASTDAGADYRKLLDQWRASLVEVADMQSQIRFSGPEQRNSLEPQYAMLASRAEAILSKLQIAAEKAYAANDQDPELTQFLYNVAVGALRTDNYEEALRLAKLLIEHHYPDKSIYRIAATAAFATMRLDDAKKYLEALGDGKIPNESGVQILAGEIEHYRPLWQQEQKLRQAEAKVDDLPRVKLHTTRGDIVLELFENEAPNTVANFISLVEKKLYDGTQFHRVLPGFMAQGGDPLSKDAAKNQAYIGSGGPGYTIADECKLPNHRDHFLGTLSMAHTSAPDSGGSQFFITFAPAPTLDGIHTVFGRVIEGLDVLPKLQRIDPTWEKEHASGVQPDRILKAEVLRKRTHPYEPKTIEKK
ncbi:MAG TPA: peptidylprolyl isomerase [Pirellulales bacterium]|jgi:cyclophilin family peptidyl-prolyl cis-trans isomerase|nr:peptidylprolyl isomerase [Pirellulales bacterium]